MGKRLPEGISLRHARSCPSHAGGRCRCTPTYQAQAWSPRDRRRLSRTLPTLAAARAWRHDALVGLRRGTVRVGPSVTLRRAAEEWLEAAQAGIVRNRSGDAYKPSAEEISTGPTIGTSRCGPYELVVGDTAGRYVPGVDRGGDGSLLEDFKPVLRYDSDEGYFADRPFVSVAAQAGSEGAGGPP